MLAAAGADGRLTLGSPVVVPPPARFAKSVPAPVICRTARLVPWALATSAVTVMAEGEAPTAAVNTRILKRATVPPPPSSKMNEPCAVQGQCRA